MDYFSACPNEIVVKIFRHVSVADLPACIEVSARWRGLIKATVLNVNAKRNRIPEVQAAFEAIIEDDYETDLHRARKLLKLPELDLNRRLSHYDDACLLSVAIANKKPKLSAIILDTRGADLDVNAADRHGERPVHEASLAGYGHVVAKIVSQAGYERGLKDDYGFNALHLAINMNAAHVPVIRALLDAGDCPVDSAYGRGSNALQTSALFGHLKACRVLIEEYGADPNAATGPDAAGSLITMPEGSAPLHFAASNNYAEVVDYLLSLPGADANARDAAGQTPLHVAAERLSYGAVRVLLACPRVDLEARDMEGSTAEVVAFTEGDNDLARIIGNAAMKRRESKKSDELEEKTTDVHDYNLRSNAAKKEEVKNEEASHTYNLRSRNKIREN